MKYLLSIAAVLGTAGTPAAGEGTVSLTKKTDTVEVAVDGEAFTVYNFSKSLPKPFFSPVRGPGGVVMTRSLENARDHKHHKGIWLAIDEVNGVDFWAERGKIENVTVKLLNRQGNPARMEVVNHWLDNDGQPVVTETTVISIFANRLIAYDIRFTAGDEPVTFGDTKEGLFGFRMVDSMRENETGRVVNAEGRQSTQECWGRVSDWVDYYGQVEGRTVGVAIFDHPLNFRRSRYHVRNYGLFSISPFGESAYTQGKRPADPLIVLPHTSVRLRYAMYIHPGDTQSADVAGTYREYLKSSH